MSQMTGSDDLDQMNRSDVMNLMIGSDDADQKFGSDDMKQMTGPRQNCVNNSVFTRW